MYLCSASGGACLQNKKTIWGSSGDENEETGVGLGDNNGWIKTNNWWCRIKWDNNFSHYIILKGVAWVQCTRALDPLRCCHVSSFVQFLNTWQHLNGSSTLVHWTQVFPYFKYFIRVQFCTVFRHVTASQRV